MNPDTTSMTVLIPHRHARALAWIKEKDRIIRSQIVRDQLAVYLADYAEHDAEVFAILYGPDS